MKKKKFAYGRVSSKGQNEARQLEAFKKYGFSAEALAAILSYLS